MSRLRELDRQVALEVMGWTCRDCGGGVVQWKNAHTVGTIHKGDPDWLPPRYSTDIAAAWQLTERLRELWDGDFHLDIYVSPGWDNSNVWVCSNRSAYERTHCEAIIGKGSTAPEAICKAALAAIAAQHAAVPPAVTTQGQEGRDGH